jgi:hypothetical protein
VSLLADLLFARLHAPHPTLLTVAVGVGLTGALLGLYVGILSRRELSAVTSRLIYVFDRTTARFIDIPGLPPSVNMRVHFGELSPERRRELAEFDRLRECFGSEFQSFVNEATEAMLLSLGRRSDFHANWIFPTYRSP